MLPAAALALAVAFAFPSQDGTRLLATGAVPNPTTLTTAVCSGGLRLPVQFERRQAEGKASTGRQSPYNFANAAGAVFRITGAKVDADSTCVLADGSLLEGATIVPLKRPPSNARCSKARYSQFQTAKSRPVVACWPIGESQTGVHVAIVEFARRLSQALASLVVIDGERQLYVDYPAEFSGPGADLWRADDGGEIHAEGFRVVFLLKRGPTFLLAINWGGGEGSALSLWTSEDGDQFKELLTDYWYQASM